MKRPTVHSSSLCSMSEGTWDYEALGEAGDERAIGHSSAVRFGPVRRLPAERAAPAPRLRVQLEHAAAQVAPVVPHAGAQTLLVHAVQVGARRRARTRPAERVEPACTSTALLCPRPLTLNASPPESAPDGRLDDHVAGVRGPAVRERTHQHTGAGRVFGASLSVLRQARDPLHELQPERVARRRVHKASHSKQHCYPQRQ